MIIIKRGRTSFYITDESVIVGNGDLQYSSYNTFTTISKSNFHKFKEAILNSQPPKFTSIVDVVELSGQLEVYGYAVRKPNLEGIEYELRP